MNVVPFERPVECASIGINQQFVRVEAMPIQRIVRPMHTIAVELSWLGLRQITVPHLLGVFWQREARKFFRAATVEKAELDFFRMRGKQCEIHAATIEGRAQWVRQSFLQHCTLHDAIFAGCRTSVARGGRVRRKDCAYPCAAIASASTAPIFPTLLPP